MKNFFVVLGGMGTMATESFLQVLNRLTPTQADQDYLDYLLVNHATIPDRTAFLLGESSDDPSVELKEDIMQLSLLAPNFFVLTCNTAHRFYDDLASVTQAPILHMPRNAVEQVLVRFPEKKVRVGLLATNGTVKTNVYGDELAKFETIETILPKEDLQQKVMDLIYRDIKEANYFNEALFLEILEEMTQDFHCDVIILGCTELSLIADQCDVSNYSIIDAQLELAKKTIALGLAQQK